ncbi:MAG: peptidase M50 [Acidobacteria bacterium]|nr:MAG: peptidase M50 [Acidobacteriota bacterium]
MPSGRQGSIHLFRFSGIDVFLHWSWFLVAMYEIRGSAGRYSSISWNILEYLGLFLIVTLHEFGHSLACRQVGGRADRIVLWPLGGVAYVDPPPRPGATLWSIAAGPLVNVVLFPVLWIVMNASRSAAAPDLFQLLYTLCWKIDLGLLIFNILPIYPLDGGQILRSLLWFVLGRGRSLMVAAVLGLIGVAGFIGLALWRRDIWLGAIAVFVLMNCWGGLQQARSLIRLGKLPRRDGFACPRCKASPPIGEYWRCGKCGQPFDTFVTHAACPSCSTQFAETKCLDCGGLAPVNEWMTATLVPSHQ